MSLGTRSSTWRGMGRARYWVSRVHLEIYACPQSVSSPLGEHWRSAFLCWGQTDWMPWIAGRVSGASHAGCPGSGQSGFCEIAHREWSKHAPFSHHLQTRGTVQHGRAKLRCLPASVFLLCVYLLLPCPHACGSSPVSPVMHGLLLTCTPSQVNSQQTPSHQDFTCFNCSVVSILDRRGCDHPRALFSDSNTKPPASLCQSEHMYCVSLGVFETNITEEAWFSTKHQSRLIKYHVSFFFILRAMKFIFPMTVYNILESSKHVSWWWLFFAAAFTKKSQPSLKNWCCFLPFHGWENWGGLSLFVLLQQNTWGWVIFMKNVYFFLTVRKVRSQDQGASRFIM